MNRTLIGACGIYCRACDHYFANTPEGEHLLKESKIRERVGKHPCKGCKAEKESEICVYCVDCDVRRCSIAKGVTLCTECAEYPCSKLERFKTGLEHHQEAGKSLESGIGRTAELWAAQTEKRWSCSVCGHPYSYYERVCVQCKSPLDGFEPDKR